VLKTSSHPGTIDQLEDVLRNKYHRPVPAADLLIEDPYKELMPEVNDVKDLGAGVIHGVECDHLAFRTKEVDWQIWIAEGARPYPCRYVITSKKVRMAAIHPRYLGMENRCRSRFRQFQIGDFPRWQEIETRSPRIQ
jgi:hypothetical protein